MTDQLQATTDTANSVYAIANNATLKSAQAVSSVNTLQNNLDSHITTANNTYAPIDSPTLTGTPKTSAVSNNPDNAQIATVAYVQSTATNTVNNIQTFSDSAKGYAPATGKTSTMQVLTSSGWKTLSDIAK